MSEETTDNDDSSELSRLVSLYELLYIKHSARRIRLPHQLTSEFPWLPKNSVIHGGGVKLTTADIEKMYGISKTEYAKVTRNFKQSPDVCFYIYFKQSHQDDKKLLAALDKIGDLERKVEDYKSGYERCYVGYLELADRLRKYETVELK